MKFLLFSLLTVFLVSNESHAEVKYNELKFNCSSSDAGDENTALDRCKNTIWSFLDESGCKQKEVHCEYIEGEVVGKDEIIKEHWTCSAYSYICKNASTTKDKSSKKVTSTCPEDYAKTLIIKDNIKLTQDFICVSNKLKKLPESKVKLPKFEKVEDKNWRDNMR